MQSTRPFQSFLNSIPSPRVPPLLLHLACVWWQLYDHMTIGSNAYLQRPANMSFAEYEADMQANGPYAYGYGCDSLDNNEVGGRVV